jgi:ElaB/YqjD/DUF883 family membrane-anchored ribosome-binding protein
MAEDTSRQDSGSTGMPAPTSGDGNMATPAPVGSTASNLGEQARSAIDEAGATAQELAQRAREQASTAIDALYRQGTRAGEYLTRNVNEYPLAALLIAGAIGYGLGYLIHTRWQSGEWQNRPEIEQGESPIEGHSHY